MDTRRYDLIEQFLENPKRWAKEYSVQAHKDILKSDMTCWEKSTRVVGKLLHSHAFQAIILFLVLVDCAVIACEIVFDEKVKTHYDYCSPNATTCQDEIDSKQTKKWKNIYMSLYYTSLALLSIFVVEVILKIVFTAKKFLKSWIHIFDALIVITSWVLMLVMLDKEGVLIELKILQDVKNGMIAEFLIAFRVIRLVHGMKEAIEEGNEIVHEKLHEELHALKHENRELKAQLAAVTDK
ncbi:Oidioi.mRNA.OKI2018_I69.chr2.g7422.t2.cds [Oikopleura dioica]|uniref:Voltage-gated hydrogen channel 1 n=1 Tax=Oikopleura dioica TaxID=34765 RepID=A0ABN7T9U7_OIKDI|nr:Oidioi.mRNA.OKI2018_I69.chr2.g7422.t2.cds [Oikopleura dioica]